MTNETNTLAEILGSKKELLRLVALATVLSFSVGLLASLVAASTVVPTKVLYVVAGILTTAVIFVLLLDMRRKLSFEDRLDGLVFIDPARNELVEVEGYELSRDLRQVLAAVKAESRSIYAEWDKDPLIPAKHAARRDSSTGANREDEPVSYISIVRMEVGDDHLNKQEASRLFDEALQFVLLEELSTHLSTHFNDSSSKMVDELSREDIPAFLLKNRVLNLLSTPIEQRDVFLKAFPNPSNRPDGVVCSLWGSDGTMYSRFDLTLPKGSSVSHTDRGAFRIETKRFHLEISGRYIGTSGVVSRAFVRHYIGALSKEVECRQVQVVVSGRVKPFALLSNKGWEHYRWLDSFRAKLRSNIDFEAFQASINWNSIEPMLHALRGNFGTLRKMLSTPRRAPAEEG